MRNSRSVGGIVWLASYPKSGNTWLRALLTNALQPGEKPADINSLLGMGAASRQLFDEWSGIKSSELTPDEVERARPRIYQALARSTSRTLFLKVHDAYTATSAGEALFPPSATRGVVYVVRHPADVAESYAHHRGCSAQEAIRLLSDPSHRMAAENAGMEGQLPQRLLSWSHHASSWLDAPLPICCVRYEDLHADPEKTLLTILDFLGESVDAERVARAVEFASFGELSRQERERGFFERPGQMRKFFRAGRVSPRLNLTEHEQKIQRDHAVMMRRMGYGVLK